MAAQRYEVDELSSQKGLHLEFEADQTRFLKAVETALYRIIHEAVTNFVSTREPGILKVVGKPVSKTSSRF